MRFLNIFLVNLVTFRCDIGWCAYILNQKRVQNSEDYNRG